MVRTILGASAECHADFVRSWLGPSREPDDAFRSAHADYEVLVREIIARRRVEAPGDDLLGVLLQARDEEGQPLDDDAIRDEANTLIFAGHTTTSLTIAYALSLLARHPGVQTELADSIDARCGGRPLATADLEQLPLLRAIVEETLRLYPVNHFRDRTTLIDMQLGGWSCAGRSCSATGWDRRTTSGHALRPTNLLDPADPVRVQLRPRRAG